MRVTAMLAWYDEPVGLLETAVRSAAVIADRLVAVDGAYEQVPDAAVASPAEQAEAIAATAQAVELGVTIMGRDRLWRGQVEKRDAMLKVAVRDSDWVMPLDADWSISGDREAIRVEIERSEADSISVRFYEPVNPERRTAEIAPHLWHAHNAGQTEWLPLLYRVVEDMRVEQKHWVYSGVKNGVRIGFWGGAHYYPPASVAQLQAPCLFEHRCLFRDDKTLQRNRIFCERRDRQVQATGVEA